MDTQPAISRFTLGTDQLVKIIDMLRHYAAPFCKVTSRLQGLFTDSERWIEKRGYADSLTPAELKRIQQVLNEVDRECEKLQLDRALRTLALFRPTYENPEHALILDTDLTLGMLNVRLHDIQKDVFTDLYDPAFVYIPKDKEQYFEQPALFDNDEVSVSDRFPEALADIKAAGNCYAVGMYTACVFHLMRVVEHGARKMMSDLKARRHLPTPRKPIELCDWGELITAIDKALGQLSAGTRTSMAKKNKFEFYNHAVAQFRNFKDAWRNNVSHLRRTYKHGGAKDVMDNTRQFMQHLSSDHKKSI
jgi:hypothetical protein